MPKILLTGGTGYIGSHTAVALVEAGYDVVILDNLSNSEKSVLDRITEITGVTLPFYDIDITDRNGLTSFFEEVSNIDGVIHFAAKKAVGESMKAPLLYYDHNIGGLINLLTLMAAKDVKNLIFSSSATVYGDAKDLPIKEKAKLGPYVSPYGHTKLLGEEILKEVALKQDNLKTVALRYFNPVGAHPSAKIGELPRGIPSNLMPFITQTAYGIREKLSVFGSDYPTPDGTAIRDYIHVMDLAEAHVKAMDRIFEVPERTAFEAFNIGTGKGISVLEMVHSFIQENDVPVNYQLADRRPGDVTAVYADTTLANEVLGWTAKRDLADMVRSSWQWEKYYREKLN